LKDKTPVTTTIKKNMGDRKQAKAAQGQYAHKAQMWFELAAFIICNLFVSLGKKTLAAMVPAAGKLSGGRISKMLHAVFAVVTLEGPRLMLLSRYRAARMERKTKVGISAAGGTAIAAVIVATVLVGSQLIAVSVDGKVIGYVSDEGQYTSLLQSAKEKISRQVGTENTEILIQDTNVSLDTVIAPQQQALTPVSSGGNAENSQTPSAGAVYPDGFAADAADAAGSGIFGAFGGSTSEEAAAAKEEALVDSLVDQLLGDGAIKAALYTIVIDGKQMATLATMKEASDVLKNIANAYTPVNGEYAGKFTDDVAINGIATELDSVILQNPDEVVAYLLAGTTVDKSYTATGEDSIENICTVLGLTEQELRTEYPEYDFDKIKEGHEFRTTLSIPFIHYETEGIEVSNDPVPYPTIEEKSDELFLGQRKTKVEGALGERRVTRAITRINGEIVASSELNSEMTKEAVPETVYVGTQIVQMGDGAYVGDSDGWGGGGNGPLGRPLNSWYLTRGVGNGHNGDDMIAPRGTPIFAAEHGTVTFVGVYGGYGNLVIIDHGNGLQTYYAHCDSFNTTEGTVVERGQQIAAVGTTGNSTAYHLHFEVRVNGVPQEPLDWLG
jgi:murein DD-endopeptidase MepM/ murein hydrolase activator NlpD